MRKTELHMNVLDFIIKLHCGVDRYVTELNMTILRVSFDRSEWSLIVSKISFNSSSISK